MIRKEEIEKEKELVRRASTCCFCFSIDTGFTLLITLEFMDFILYTVSFIMVIMGVDEENIIDEYNEAKYFTLTQSLVYLMIIINSFLYCMSMKLHIKNNNCCLMIIMSY